MKEFFKKLNNRFTKYRNPDLHELQEKIEDLEAKNKLYLAEIEGLKADKLEATKIIELLGEASDTAADMEENTKVKASFSISKEGACYIQYSWDQEDEKTVEYLATLLYHLNAGALEEKTLSVIVQYAKDNPHMYHFFESILQKYATVQNQNQKEKVVVKPSEVFQLGRQTFNRNTHLGGNQ